MTTFAVILFVLLAATALAARFSSRRPKLQEMSRPLPASQFDGLFAEQHAEESKLLAEEDARLLQATAREQLIKRTATGDLEALDEIRTLNDPPFYEQALQTILIQADGNPKLFQSTVEHIVASQKLRSSREFAESAIRLWAASPDQFQLGDVLFLAALADDEAVFRQALDTAVKLWRENRIQKVSAQNFLSTVESAYWLVASEVRNSGAGFLLKQAIADVRRALAAANRQSA